MRSFYHVGESADLQKFHDIFHDLHGMQQAFATFLATQNPTFMLLFLLIATILLKSMRGPRDENALSSCILVNDRMSLPFK